MQLYNDAVAANANGRQQVQADDQTSQYNTPFGQLDHPDQYAAVTQDPPLAQHSQQNTLNQVAVPPAPMTTTQGAVAQPVATENVKKTPRPRKRQIPVPSSSGSQKTTTPNTGSSQKTSTPNTGNNEKTPSKKGKNQVTPGSSAKRKRDLRSGATGSEDTDEESVDLTQEEKDQALSDAIAKKKASAKKAADTRERIKREEAESIDKIEAQRAARRDQHTMLQRIRYDQQLRAQEGRNRFDSVPGFDDWLEDMLRPARDRIPIAFQKRIQSDKDLVEDLLKRLEQIRKRNSRKDDQG